jgi:cell division protein FtsB
MMTILSSRHTLESTGNCVTIRTMTAQEYLNAYQGQSLLYGASPAREWLRGQCVQSVCFYVAANGRPVIWADAYNWWTTRNAAYDYIDNSPSAVPQPGDIIVWGPNTPGSGGAGHIAVCLQPRPGTGTFVSVDQNWGGKYVHAVTHNYDNVVGWLRFKNASPAPAPTPQGGDEMITNADQADKIYKLMRPNGAASQDEINATAGKRSFANFLDDAQTEVNQRDANFRAQTQHMADLQKTIDTLNTTITTLQTEGVKNKTEYDSYVAKIAQLTTDLTSAHDQLKELQDSLPTAQPMPTQEGSDDMGFLTKLIAWLLRKKS